MDVLKLGASLLAQKLGSNASEDAVQSALSGLIGNGDKVDIAGMLGAAQGDSGLAGIAQSWLGDGENSPISAEQVKQMVGGEKLSQAAAQLGTDENSLLSGLQSALPDMVDKGSSGGSLLDSLGGVGGLADAAKKLL